MRKIRKASDTSNPRPIEIYAMSMEIGIYGWLAGGLFHSDHEIDPAYWFLAFTVVIHRIRFAAGNTYDDDPNEDSESLEHVPSSPDVGETESPSLATAT